VFRFLSDLPHGAFFIVGAVAARLADEGKVAQAALMMFFGLTITNLARDAAGRIGDGVVWSIGDWYTHEWLEKPLKP
jgi:predicted MFS family arabinose efflux permease